MDFWAFQAKDIVNIAILVVTCWAVYYGPIRAVKISRQQETEAQKLGQKSAIFASLMKTRRFQLDPEHVSSLNIIQVYFHDEPEVLRSYKEYIKLLSRRPSPDFSSESLVNERDDAFIELVASIAKSLGFSQDKREIQELGYSPEGWANDRDTVRKLHFLMAEIFEGRRPLPVAPFMQVNNSPYPPAPTSG